MVETGRKHLFVIAAINTRKKEEERRKDRKKNKMWCTKIKKSGLEHLIPFVPLFLYLFGFSSSHFSSRFNNYTNFTILVNDAEHSQKLMFVYLYTCTC